jgi:hypothetical protein
MYCEKCGKQIGDDARFCPYCGHPVSLTEGGSNTSNSPARDISKLTITRENKKDGAGFVKIAVSIDEKNIAKLKKGESITIDITPGYHKITTKLNADSQSLRFISTGDPILISYGEIKLPDGKGGYLTNRSNAESVASSRVASDRPDNNTEQPVMSFDSTSPYGNHGKLNLYIDRMTFAYQNGDCTTYQYSDISGWQKKISGIEIFMDGKSYVFKLPHGAANDIITFLKQQSPDRWRQAHPESIFNKTFGTVDQVLINEDYGTFCIRPVGRQNGKTYLIKDIIKYEIQEIKADGGDALEGALIGGALAGKRGALAGAFLQPTGRNKIGKIVFRATIKNGSKVETVAAYLMNEDISPNSQKYTYYRNQEMELKSIIDSKL